MTNHSLHHPLHGCWEKLRHGQRHQAALDRAVTSTMRRMVRQEIDLDARPKRLPVTIRSEFDSEHQYFLVRVLSTQPTPVSWGLMVGDAVHDFRCVLDHLAWYLVSLGRTPQATLRAEQLKRIQFPIFSDWPDYNRALDRMLPGVRRAHGALIRRYQPYHRGQRAAEHPLALLANLSNGDKHRVIQPTWFQDYSRGFLLPKRFIRDCEVLRVEMSTTTDRLEVGAEVGRIHVRQTGPHPDVEVYVESAVRVTLDNAQDLLSGIQLIARMVYDLLIEFEALLASR